VVLESRSPLNIVLAKVHWSLPLGQGRRWGKYFDHSEIRIFYPGTISFQGHHPGWKRGDSPDPIPSTLPLNCASVAPISAFIPNNQTFLVQRRSADYHILTRITAVTYGAASFVSRPDSIIQQLLCASWPSLVQTVACWASSRRCWNSRTEYNNLTQTLFTAFPGL